MNDRELLELAAKAADILQHKIPSIECLEKAAAELRRLYQSEREGWRYADELEQERKRLNEVNQMLVESAEMALEALENIHSGNMTPMAEESWNKAMKALRRALEQSRQETKHGAYAGVIIWLGDKRVAKLITETEIKYEREAGFVITEVAQSCLDELAEAEKHK